MNKKIMSLMVMFLLLGQIVSAFDEMLDLNDFVVGDGDYDIEVPKMSLVDRIKMGDIFQTQTVIGGATCSANPDYSVDYSPSSETVARACYTNNGHDGMAYQLFIVTSSGWSFVGEKQLLDGAKGCFDVAYGTNYHIDLYYCDGIDIQRDCYDSDSKDYYDEGYVTVTIDGDSDTWYDECDGNYVYERYCDSDESLNSVSFYCPNGCDGGACREEADPITCDGHDASTSWCYSTNEIGACSSNGLLTRADCDSPLVCKVDRVNHAICNDPTDPDPTGTGNRGAYCISDEQCEGDLICTWVDNIFTGGVITLKEKICLDMNIDTCNIACASESSILVSCKVNYCKAQAQNCYIPDGEDILGRVTAISCMNCIPGALKMDEDIGESSCCSGLAVGNICKFGTFIDNSQVTEKTTEGVKIDSINSMTTGAIFEHGCVYDNDCKDDSECLSFAYLIGENKMTGPQKDTFYEILRPTIEGTMAGMGVGAVVGGVACYGLVAAVGAFSGGAAIIPLAPLCTGLTIAGAGGGAVLGGTYGYGSTDYVKAIQEQDTNKNGICVSNDDDGDGELDICSLDFLGSVKGLEDYSCLASVGIMIFLLILFAKVAGG